MLTTSELIKKYGLGAKKALGQNFILDKNITDKIAKSAGDLSEYEVLEIGPGPGGLTRSILDAGAKKLIVIEKDERCLAALAELKEFYGKRLEIISADALEIDEKELFASTGKIKIIANLPYNIGTVLLLKWLKIAPKIASMTLMLQKEVIDRIVAKPSGEHYGRLSVMVNHLAQSKMLFTVSRTVFVPPPKVTSAIVQVIPYENLLYKVEFNKLEKLVAAAFSQRRKMIKSALKNFPFINNKNFSTKKDSTIVQNNSAEENNCDALAALAKCNIDGNLRAENLTIQQFCELAKIS